ncbi:uncharacterized protein [Polyergus mexicanus]|uniref:uncharacterized protein n=1 Tax=Polyergus mexicanus TaxID=615972 RepID=UPI0038B4245C
MRERGKLVVPFEKRWYERNLDGRHRQGSPTSSSVEVSARSTINNLLGISVPLSTLPSYSAGYPADGGSSSSSSRSSRSSNRNSSSTQPVSTITSSTCCLFSPRVRLFSDASQSSGRAEVLGGASNIQDN